MVLESAMKRLEGADALDQPAGKLAGVVAAATRPRLVKNALSGTWLGHRFHRRQRPVGPVIVGQGQRGREDAKERQNRGTSGHGHVWNLRAGEIDARGAVHWGG